MRKLIILIVAVSILSASLIPTVYVYASTGVEVGFAQQSQAAPQQQGRAPEANLPFLFAVFTITWAAFFGYVFFISRRQREMQREIEALKRALVEKERQASENSPPQQIGAQSSQV